MANADLQAIQAALGIDLDLSTITQEIILASSHFDIPKLKNLLKQEGGSVNLKDEESGVTPLHAAVSALILDADAPQAAAVNGNHEASEDEEIDKAADMVRFLFENGAIWNDLDAKGDTPGCIAYRIGRRGRKVYDLIVAAGVRAEVLLARLDEYTLLHDQDENTEEDDIGQDEAGEDGERVDSDGVEVADPAAQDTTAEDGDEDIEIIDIDEDEDAEMTNETYLSAPLRFSSSRILDSSNNAVMMSWETQIMSRTAEVLFAAPMEASSAQALNIGHGMAIMDTALQSHSPAAHHIIEAHPDVLARMHETEWTSKSGVTVHNGTWQEKLPELVADADAPLFDVIYYDTFAEDYAAFKRFFEEFVIGLLREGGRWSFFNGLGADRQVCYDVYQKVLEMDLWEAGFDVEWIEINPDEILGRDHANGNSSSGTSATQAAAAVDKVADDETWKGVRRKYWVPDTYRIPICTWVSS